MEESHPILKICHACFSYSWAVFERTEIADVQFHRAQLGFHFSIGMANMAQVVDAPLAIVSLCLRHESNSAAGKKNTAEILAVVIP
jgi:hypothetical protein